MSDSPVQPSLSAPLRVLVTGAGGFVCSNIVSALLDEGHTVIAVDRIFEPDLRALWGARVTFVETDAAKLPAIEADVLVHGAAITADPKQAKQTPEANFRSNLDPLLAAVEWASTHNVKRALFLSSAAVHRESAPGPVSETEPLTPYGLYAVAKATMESLIETLKRQYKRDVAVVRLSNVYGPREHSRPSRPRTSLIYNMISQALRVGRLEIPAYEPARDWTFAPDVGRAICAMLTAPALKYPVYNVAAGELVTPIEIAGLIQQHLPHVSANPNTTLPMSFAPITRRGYLSNKRLHEDVGFDHWMALSVGLKLTIEWARQHAEGGQTLLQ